MGDMEEKLLHNNSLQIRKKEEMGSDAISN